MTEDKTKEYRVRLRHVHSDIGPFSVPPTMTMGELKRRAFEEWPIEGAIAGDKPGNAADIRLISGGRFIEDGVSVQALAKQFGDGASEPDFLMTLHVIVRSPFSRKACTLWFGLVWWTTNPPPYDQRILMTWWDALVTLESFSYLWEPVAEASG